MKIYIAHSSHFDFKNKLYMPLRGSVLDKEHEILLPHEDEEIKEITRDMIKNCDVLVAEVSTPSLGAGIEIGWADAFGVPVIAMSEKEVHVSWSIDNAVTERFKYENASDMIQKLSTILKKYQ